MTIVRVFSRKDGETEPVSVRMSTALIQAVEHLADKAGESRNATLVLLLDEALQMKARDGLVPWPKGYNPKQK